MNTCAGYRPVLFSIAVSLIFSINNFAEAQNKTRLVKQKVDSVRINYEKIINRKISSLNVLIHTPEDIIFVSSVNEGDKPITKDTYFRFGSNTKNFTAAAILNMQQSGWLNIKDKIIDTIPGSNMLYIPDIPEFNVPYKNQITIEQLLQHSAGVYDICNDPVPGCEGINYVYYTIQRDPTHQFVSTELVNAATKNNLSYFPPGKGYHYSNTGYTILSEIIGRVYSFRSGGQKKYADYLKDFITGKSAVVPLDIEFPGFATDDTMNSPMVAGKILFPDSATIYSVANMSAHVGEGNGYTTFVDLDRYLRSIMKGENVLDSNSISLMKNSVSDSNKTYGLGCYYTKGLGYGHNGCTKGYLSMMAYDPEYDVSVITMVPENDFSSETSIVHCMNALTNSAIAARNALGYP